MAKVNRTIITKDWTFGDVIERYPFPEVTNKIQEYGLHCVGCHIASWETLEQGILGHGLDGEVLEKLINDLNEIIADLPEQPKGGLNLPQKSEEKKTKTASKKEPKKDTAKKS